MWWEILPPLLIYMTVFLQNGAHVLSPMMTLSPILAFLSMSVNVSTTDSPCIYFSGALNIPSPEL